MDRSHEGLGLARQEAGLIAANLSDDEWAEIVEKLTLYADNKMRKLRWRGVLNGAVLGGVCADDMAATAIESLLYGGRNWNQEKTPDLFEFLKDVVDSKVSNLVKGEENKKSRQVDADDQKNEPAFRGRRNTATPPEIMSDEEQRKRIRSSVMAEIGQDELVESILECYESGIEKPSEIAELVEVTTKDVNNAKKRINRAADKAFGKARK